MNVLLGKPYRAVPIVQDIEETLGRYCTERNALHHHEIITHCTALLCSPMVPSCNAVEGVHIISSCRLL